MGKSARGRLGRPPDGVRFPLPRGSAVLAALEQRRERVAGAAVSSPAPGAATAPRAGGEDGVAETRALLDRVNELAANYEKLTRA
jgi:hypothetical protein